MYNRFFGLEEDPFSIAANPRFVYLSDCHREALAHLLYGIRSDSGFVLLTGEIGTGKTTMCRCLLEQLPADTEVAFILNPRVTVPELLASICDELHIEAPADASIKRYVDAINANLLQRHARGGSTVVIIDEAQNLSFDVLEQLRLLTNLETNERKLLRIILIGQPELESMLRRPEFRQLEQRITARYHLKPLARAEIGRYLSHRLAVAGCDEPVFSTAIASRIYAHSRGIPRRINIICDRALLGAYARSKRRVDKPILVKAAREVDGEARTTRQRGPMLLLTGLLLGLVALLLVQLNDGADGWFARQGAIAIAGGVGGNDGAAAKESGASAKETSTATDAEPLVVAAIAPADRPGEVSAAAPANWPDAVTAADNSLARAFSVQFERWRIDPPPTAVDPCAGLRTYQLYCFSGVANLGSLLDYDRPAVLTLRDDDGERYYVTLLELNEERASLAFAHGIESVPVNQLEARWRGNFQLLWRGSPLGATLISPGNRGANVTWLTEALAVAGVPVAATDVFDGSVFAAVKTFQREHDLVADGIVGRQTLMRLNSLADSSIPRLGKSRAG